MGTKRSRLARQCPTTIFTSHRPRHPLSHLHQESAETDEILVFYHPAVALETGDLLRLCVFPLDEARRQEPPFFSCSYRFIFFGLITSTSGPPVIRVRPSDPNGRIRSLRLSRRPLTSLHKARFLALYSLPRASNQSRLSPHQQKELRQLEQFHEDDFATEWRPEHIRTIKQYAIPLQLLVSFSSFSISSHQQTSDSLPSHSRQNHRACSGTSQGMHSYHQNRRQVLRGRGTARSSETTESPGHRIVSPVRISSPTPNPARKTAPKAIRSSIGQCFLRRSSSSD